MDKTFSFSWDGLHMEIPSTNWVVNLGTTEAYALTFGTSALYIACILWIFPAIGKRLSDKTVEAIAKVHFGALFVFSLVSFLAGLLHIWFEGQLSDLQAYSCTPLPGWLRLISIAFTVSKIWEWGDTAIFQWRKQSLSKIGFLHTYHHATTFFLFVHVMNFPSTEKAGLIANGFVHTLMYYHYAFRLPKFMRPLITFSQIVQLISVTYIWGITPDVCPAYQAFRNDHYVNFLIPYAFVPVYLLFFIKFFFEQYVLPKPTANDIPKSKPKTN